MDYVDFIVHVFSAEKRAFYGLERLRKTAVTVSVDELSEDLKRATATKVKASRKTAAVPPLVERVAKSPAKKSGARKAYSAKKAAVKKAAPSSRKKA